MHICVCWVLAGLALIVRSQNSHGHDYLEIIGIVLLVVGVFFGPFVIVIHRWRREKQADSRAEKLANASRNLRPFGSKHKVDNEQDILAIGEEWSTMSTWMIYETTILYRLSLKTFGIPAFTCRLSDHRPMLFPIWASWFSSLTSEAQKIIEFAHDILFYFNAVRRESLLI